MTTASSDITLEELNESVTNLHEEFSDEMKILKEGLIDEVSLVSKETFQISSIYEKINEISENIDSMKGEILEEINLNVKENYTVKVMDEKINILRGEVENIRGDVQQLKEEFRTQMRDLHQLILDLPEKIAELQNK